MPRNDADAPRIEVRTDRAGNDRLTLEFSGMMGGPQDHGAGPDRMIDALTRQLRATIAAGERSGTLVLTIPDVCRG
jgi:hypothetical protein